MQKKVLMIAFHYPPWAGGSGVHRTLKFTRYLPEFGWQPIVLAANSGAYPINGGSPAAIPEHIEITRAFALDTRRHLSIRGSYFQWMSLPDRWITWWPGAIAAGMRVLRRHKPDVIWSTYPIATAHLIGLTLHRISGLPWVADFRDPMIEVDPDTGKEYPEEPGIRKANRWIEERTIKYCSKAVFTTPGTLNRYRSRFPDTPQNRWTIIANGYDEEDFAIAERAVPCSSQSAGPVVLLHSGILYANERDPTNFFSALSDLRRAGCVKPSTLKVVLRATGFDELYQPMLESLGIDDIVTLKPQISHPESLVEMLNADGLLVFQAGNSNQQIPSKLYEYLRAGRPILAVADRGGDTADLLRSEGIDSIVSLDSKSEITEGLMRFLSAIRSHKYPSAKVDRHSRRARTHELAELLQSLSWKPLMQHQ